MYVGTKIGVGLALLTGTGVSGYFVSDYLSVKIEEKLKGTKVTGKEDWKKKLASLKTAEKDSLVNDLEQLKSKDSGLEEWCNQNYRAYFKDENDTRFKNVQMYCTYNNKDKLPDKAITDTSKWTAANGVLTGKSDGLSETMQSIKGKITTDNKALEKWCNNFYKEIWNAQETQDFKDAKEYCVEK